MTKPTVILVGPLPPPVHGVTISTQRLLSSSLREKLDLRHLDTSDHRSMETVGALDFRNVALGRDTYGIGSAPLLAAWCGLLANSFVVDTLHWRHLWLLAGLIWAGTHATGVRRQLSSRVGRAAVR